MCLLCSYGGRNIHTTQGLDYIGSNSLGNILSETSDAPNSTSTNYSISAGDSFSGNLSSSGDYSLTFDKAGEEVYKITHGSSGLFIQNDGDNQIGLIQDHDIRFYNDSGNETVVFRNSGNVGIGTTSPSYKLVVKGGRILIDGDGSNSMLSLQNATANRFSNIVNSGMEIYDLRKKQVNIFKLIKTYFHQSL